MSVHSDDGDRFIPTHVGNTLELIARVYAETVHPHACGEHVNRATPGMLQDGSSPRMWGTRVGPFPFP